MKRAPARERETEHTHTRTSHSWQSFSTALAQFGLVWFCFLCVFFFFSVITFLLPPSSARLRAIKATLDTARGHTVVTSVAFVV